MTNQRALRVVAAGVLLVTAACSGSTGPTSDGATPSAATIAEGFVVLVDGLDRPTQIAEGPEGSLLVAQLAGDEADAVGQVLAVDVASGAKRVLLEGLDKPTGVLWESGALWVMVRNGLIRSEWPGGPEPAGPIEVVLDGLASNGRSEGTLTGLRDGRFLYETSGSLIGQTIASGSGTLWVFDPGDRTSQPVATGLKNAYAHAVLGDGRIVTTDIGDNIDDAPVEELNVVTLGQTIDLGWPACPGDQTCQGVPDPVAIFPRSSTPTGVAVVGTTAYVTLFVTGQLMRIALTEVGDRLAGGTPEEVLDGLAGPHTVLARLDGTLWISEHLANRIIVVEPDR